MAKLVDTTKVEKIEIKALRTFPSLTNETDAFTANVYINGKKVIEAKNDGHGGMNDYYPVKPYTWEDVENVQNYLKTNFEASMFKGSNIVLFHSLDYVIEEAINDKYAKEHLKKIEKHLKKKFDLNQVVFINTEQEIRLYPSVGNETAVKRVIDRHLTNNPEDIILNTMDISEAVLQYKKVADNELPQRSNNMITFMPKFDDNGKLINQPKKSAA